MGSTLAGNLIANTFDGILKTCDNANIAGSKLITDGCGNNTSFTLGAAGQGSTFDVGGLTVNGVFEACGLTYPQSIGSNNQIFTSDGSGGSSFSSLNVVLSSTALSSTVIDNNTTYSNISAIKVDSVGRINEVITGEPESSLYFVNAIQAGQPFYLTANTNSSSNVYPNTAVKTYAMSIYPSLKAGDKVQVVWGYRTVNSANGTQYAFQYAMTVYEVINSSTWNTINSGSLN